MRRELKEVQKQLESRIYEVLESLLYEVDRYEKECSLALIFSFDKLDVDKIKKIARKSDIIMQIDENSVFIIYRYTPIDGGIKATEKILVAINPKFTSKIYASVVDCTPNMIGRMMVHNLFNLVEFAIDNSHENEVLDMSYLDGIY